MASRLRSIQQKFYVTKPELDLIHKRVRLLGTSNKSAYLRKMAVDGYIINVDYSDIKANTAQLQRIGSNINQIVKRMNQTGSLYMHDVAEVKAILNDIWQTQRKLMLRSRAPQ